MATLHLEHSKTCHNIDMVNGPIFGKLLRFTVPIMASGILQLLFNAADIVVLGKFAGDNSLAAVGSNTALINLLINMFMGLAIGVNVVAAKFYGAKREKDLQETVHTAMLLSLFCGIVLTIIGVLMAETILVWMQTPPEVLDLAVLYLRIYFAGTIPLMLYNFGAALLRAVGDSRRPLFFLTAAGVVNVGLNLLFVLVFKLDVAGVALATVLSETLSAVMVVVCLMQEKSAVKLSLKKLKIYKAKLLDIIRIGLPAGLQGTVFALSNVVIQSSINLFGSTVVAGNAAAANVEGFAYFAMTAFYQATISFVSQNFGAKQFKRIDRIVLEALASVTVVGLIVSNLLVLFAPQLLSIYSTNQAVIAAGELRMRYICHTYVLCGIMEVLVGALRGVGFSMSPMLISLIGVCGFRFVWIATAFQQPQYHSVNTIYWSYPLSWMIAIAALVVCVLVVRNVLRKKAVSESFPQLDIQKTEP